MESRRDDKTGQDAPENSCEMRKQVLPASQERAREMRITGRVAPKPEIELRRRLHRTRLSRQSIGALENTDWKAIRVRERQAVCAAGPL